MTLVAKATNFDWDYLIWILYDVNYSVAEAWKWGVKEYRKQFEFEKRLSPAHMRQGIRVGPKAV